MPSFVQITAEQGRRYLPASEETASSRSVKDRFEKAEV